jgi:hypothetical protein
MHERDNFREEHFRRNCLAWVTLYHFLPANLVRELSYVLVDAVSGGDVAFESLFEEELIKGPDSIDTWLLKPLDVESPLAEYLQRRIRYLVWQHDGVASVQEDMKPNVGKITPAVVENAVLLGCVDLSTAERVLEEMRFPHQESFSALLSAIIYMTGVRTGSVEMVLNGVERYCGQIEMPLQAVIVKHIADLCGDADEWEKALALYDDALARYAKIKDAHWDSFIKLLKDITLQSKSAGLRITKGPKESAALLSDRFKTARLADARLLYLNASHDAYVAGSMASDKFGFPPDRRATSLLPPQLLSTHDIGSAMEYWLEEKFAGTSQNFWGVLRRQIALGSATDARLTKAYYGRSILTELDKSADRDKRPEAFWTAMRLLLESGQAASVAKFVWSERIVRLYVDTVLVDAVIVHVNRNEGAKTERINVALECFRCWTEALAAEDNELATKILKSLASVAQDNSASLFSSQNAGGRSLELLYELAERRPEFRAGAAHEVAVAIAAKLNSDEFWKGKAEALKVAGAYLNVFSEPDVSRVVSAALTLLDSMDPAKDLWPIVQPALEFLMSEDLPRLLGAGPEPGKRVISAILRFGLNQRTEHARFLFYLQNFDLPSIDASMAEQLKEAVKRVRTSALNINASNAIYNINALLYGSKASGQEGVVDALLALTRILETAPAARPSMSLGHAYSSLGLLAERQRQIVTDTSVLPDIFHAQLERLLDLVVGVWSSAEKNPLIFAPFSIPPATQPSSTLIYNWAFCSLSFALSLEAAPKMLTALSSAQSQPVLRNSVTLARAARLAGGDDVDLTVQEIRLENREAFYASLGQRLIRLQRLSGEARRSIIEAFVARCLRLGPQGLDAAVFLSAAELGFRDFSADPEYWNYLKRLENNRELRLALMPMVGMQKAHH